jgi:hypothetical protein
VKILGDDTVDVERRDVSLIVLAFIILAIAMGVNVVDLVVLRNQAAQASSTHAAVCTYRRDLAQQVASSRAFLKTHPNGLPALGVSAGQIRQSIDRQASAVQSLSDLHCG